MKRAALIIATMVIVAGIPLMTGTASAAPSNGVTITLACDHGTSTSTITVSLTDASGNFDGRAVVACGSSAKRNRVEIPLLVAPTDAHVEAWSWTVGSQSGSCGPADGSVPFKASCGDANGTGATITIR